MPGVGSRGEPAAAPQQEGAGGDGAVEVSGFLLEPVSGAAAGGPGHVMPGPGGGQAGDPVAAGRRGASGGGTSRGRRQPGQERGRGSAPSSLAAAVPPPGVGSFGRAFPAPGALRQGAGAAPRSGCGGCGVLSSR